MKRYPYTTYGEIADEYGQIGYGNLTPGGFEPITPIRPNNPLKATTSEQQYITMAIYLSNQATNQNINYVEADFIGLTTEEVNDRMFIEYDGLNLKVKYVNQMGRFNIVALVKV